MSQKLTDDQEGEAVVLALRLPPKLIEALDQVQREQESEMRVKARLSRSSVARALLEEALRKHGALPALEAPVAREEPPSAPVTESKPSETRTKPKAKRKGTHGKTSASVGHKSTKRKAKTKRSPKE